MTKRVYVLAEGQTEERFVKDTIAPIFISSDTYVIARVLETKRLVSGKKFVGGVTSFAKFERDVKALLASARSNALVTTFVDYYGLPEDFPGMADRKQVPDARGRVQHVESAIHRHFGSPQNFKPFLILHEFEALLFTSDAA